MMMDWQGFAIGVMTTLFAYALFSSNEQDEEEMEVEETNEEVEVHDFQARHVTLSCQTCRKLKRHKEVEPNLFSMCKM